MEASVRPIVVRKKSKSYLSYDELELENNGFQESVRYALRIQEGILPKKRHIERIWPNTFVFYKPKDVVSGDFYWMAQKDQYVFWVVADCSGHGIPGAMLTMLGNSYLNYIILGKELVEPEDILNEMDKKMNETFRYSEDSEQIDIALIRLDKNTNQLTFAGARRKLVQVSESKIAIYQGDKFPIGGLFLESNRNFKQIEITYAPGDMIYIGSDGFQDQFGGAKKKKLSSKILHELLASISNYEVELQLIHLRMFFKEWKQNLAQVDDVCVMGIRM
jgi:sigma-B regulation protein RsbU (phosphoserine phosphatase)